MPQNYIKLLVLIQLTVLSLCSSISKRYPILMISFDGMRSSKFEEFLKENPNSAFNEIIKDGVKAEYMIPSFPTLTFPNHYTLVTGMAL
jgi:predicted AlkP superfamily pyrophosphatase or phosphodiesterase